MLHIEVAPVASVLDRAVCDESAPAVGYGVERGRRVLIHRHSSSLNESTEQQLASQALLV